MKRRKVIGLMLLTATAVYLFASFLALYQNQRVTMEKGIEEALKAYSEKESQSVKELNKDINLLLDEKVDISELREEKVNNEGSFARIDKNVTNVTNQMTALGKNVTDVTNLMTVMEKNITNVKEEILIMENQINNLSDKVIQIENYNKTLYEEVLHNKDSITVINEEVLHNKDSISVIKEEIETITNRILEMEKWLSESDLRQEDDMSKLQERLQQVEEKMIIMEDNVLYYSFDDESGTLNIYGNKVQQESE